MEGGAEEGATTRATLSCSTSSGGSGGSGMSRRESRVSRVGSGIRWAARVAVSALRSNENIKGVERFVPECLMAKIIDGEWTAPQCEGVVGAVMLADISGYTALTEKLSAASEDGIEELTGALNRYFKAMTDTIYRHGGDVIKFAGDALLVAFFLQRDGRVVTTEAPGERMEYWADFEPLDMSASDLLADMDSCMRCGEALETKAGGPRQCASCGVVSCADCCSTDVRNLKSDAVVKVCDHCSSSSRQIFSRLSPASSGGQPSEAGEGSSEAREGSGELHDVVLRSAQCALEMATKLDGYESLRLHVGIGAGKIQSMSVGGVSERWEMLLAGEALVQMSTAEGESNAGEVCLSSEAWSLVAARCEGTRRGQHGVVHLQAVRAPLPECESEWRWAKWDQPNRTMSWKLPPDQAMQSMLKYIPRNIRQSLIHHRSDLAITELRRVSVLFINLPTISFANNANVLDTLQQVMVTMQVQLEVFEGFCRQFIMDDKGTTLIGVFGLFPFSHENDPLLATKCAMSIRDKLSALGTPGKIGVTTGRVFAGLVGCLRRCEYALVGSTVNMSARLMAAMLSPKYDLQHLSILTDSETHQAARKGVHFQELEPIKVKGKVEPMAIFTPTGMRKHRRRSIAVEAELQSHWPVESQTEPVDVISSRLERLAVSAAGSVVVLQGELGMGKTHLLNLAVAEAFEIMPDVVLVRGTADMHLSSDEASFHAFLGVVDSLQQKIGRVSSDRLSSSLHGTPVLGNEAPPDGPQVSVDYLMSLVASALNLAEAEEGLERGSEPRRSSLGRSQDGLQEGEPEPVRMILLVDNTQWLDTSSWEFLMQLADRITLAEWPVLLILSLRQSPDSETTSDPGSPRTPSFSSPSWPSVAAAESSSTAASAALSLSSSPSPATNHLDPRQVRSVAASDLASRRTAQALKALEKHGLGHFVRSNIRSLDCDQVAKLCAQVLVDLLPEKDGAVDEQDAVQTNDFAPRKRRVTVSVHVEDVALIEIPEALVDLVWQNGNGNTLYTIEILRTLVQQEAVSISNGVAYLQHSPDDLEMVALPTSLHGVMTQKLDKLASTDLWVMKVASVLAVAGGVFDVTLLAQVRAASARGARSLETGATDAGSESDISESLQTFLRAKLIVPSNDERHRTYYFSNPLLLKSCYTLLPVLRRNDLHAAAAAEISKRLSTGDGLFGLSLAQTKALMATHFERAGKAEDALQNFAEAVTISMKRFAHFSAIQHSECALQTLQACRDATGSNAAANDPVPRRNSSIAPKRLTFRGLVVEPSDLDLHTSFFYRSLGTSSQALSYLEAAEQYFLRALPEDSSGTRPHRRSGTGTFARLDRLKRGVSVDFLLRKSKSLLQTGSPAPAAEVQHEVRKVEEEVLTTLCLANLHVVLGRLESALDLAMGALSTCLGQRDRSVLRHASGGFFVLGYCCATVLFNSRLSQHCSTRGTEWAMHHMDFVGLVVGKLHACTSELTLGRCREARNRGQEALKLASDMYDNQNFRHATLLLGEVSLVGGQLNESEALLSELCMRSLSHESAIRHTALLERALLLFSVSLPEALEHITAAVEELELADHQVDFRPDTLVLHKACSCVLHLHRGTFRSLVLESCVHTLLNLDFQSHRLGMAFLLLIELFLEFAELRRATVPGADGGQETRFRLVPTFLDLLQGLPPPDSGSPTLDDPLDDPLGAASQLLANFKSYTSVFVCYNAARQRLLGRWLWLSSQRSKAESEWQKGMRTAKQQGNQLEEARLRLERNLWIAPVASELEELSVQFSDAGAHRYAQVASDASAELTGTGEATAVL